jgi:hypothetical protein
MTDVNELSQLSDRELLQACINDKNTNDKCSNEFWRERYINNFGDTGDHKDWRTLYLETLIGLDIAPFYVKLRNILEGPYKNAYMSLGEANVDRKTLAKNFILWQELKEKIYECYNNMMLSIKDNKISPNKRYQRLNRTIKWVNYLNNIQLGDPKILYENLTTSVKECIANTSQYR